jgi:hypothetical protein
MSKKRTFKGDIKTAAKKLSGVANRTAEFFGLLEESPEAAPQPNCGVDGCTTSQVHRHPTTIVDRSQMNGSGSNRNAWEHDELDDDLHAQARVLLGHDCTEECKRPHQFETGATEHLPENVVSMKDFKDRKKARKPEGY